MAKGRDLSSGWISYEVYQRDSEGRFTITPFSATLASSGSLAKPAISRMRTVQNVGWPQARRHFKDENGHSLVVKKDDVVWLLKCKPSCWRLYFYVRSNGKEKRIVYLYAVCKKKDAEDRSDAVKARNVYDGIRPGGSALTEFEFPAG